VSDNLPEAVVFEADEYNWKQHPVSGEWVPPKLQQAFLDFLATPAALRDFPSQTAWAQANGVAADRLKRWKKDQRFQNALWKKARNVLLDPQVLTDIFHYISRAAMDDELSPSLRFKYMRTYLELVGEIGAGSGGNVWVNVFPTPVEQLSESELEAQLAALERDRNTIDGEVVDG
jgi:hypothetical protein